MALVLFCKHSKHIEFLEQEIEWLRLQMLHERQRAERAIDLLLAHKVASGPVTLSSTSPTPDTLVDEIKAMMTNSEFSQAGQV